MILFLIIAFVVIAIVIMLTDKTSPFYNASLTNGVHLSALTKNNPLYQQYKSEDVAMKSATLLMSVYDSPGENSDKIQIYRNRQDGQIVLVDHKNCIASISKFFFDSAALNDDSYDYHPAEVIYTGATSGGIHMGGTHVNPAHYTHHVEFSGNARLSLNYAKNLPCFLVACVKLNKPLFESAKSTDVVKNYLGEDGFLTVLRGSSSSPSLFYSHNVLSEQSWYKSSCGIPINDCKRIASWLTTVAK